LAIGGILLHVCQVCIPWLNDKDRNTLLQSLRPVNHYDFRIAEPPYIENSCGKFFALTPRCWTILSHAATGTAHLIANKEKKMNRNGHRIRYLIDHIEIKKSLLNADLFMEAFATYCHELCHCFGGDASKTFSLALTDVIALTVQKQSVLVKFQEQWRLCFCKLDKKL
jgi:hypothetical protein